MRLDKLSAHAATKLLTLDQEHRALTEEATALDKEIAFSRRVFNHGVEDPDLDARAMMQGFPALLEREKAASQRRRAAAMIYEQTRRWVEHLGEDVVLETAAVKV